ETNETRGTPAPAAPPAAPRGLPKARRETKTLELSNGAVFAYREPCGRDMERAAMAAQGGGDFAAAVALIAQVGTVDDVSLPYEEYMELTASELNRLIGAVLGNDPASDPATSSV
ncbi:MAG TPA: hypothetical protein VGB66_01920, partial [Longimicrobium sp.]